MQSQAVAGGSAEADCCEALPTDGQVRDHAAMQVGTSWEGVK